MNRKSSARTLYDHPSDMEPLLPIDTNGELAQLSLTLMRRSERLAGSLHSIVRKSVADVIRSMNSYYSNLIEGHRTTPRDIEAALTRDFSKNPSQKALQIQHLAHIEVQAEMEAKVAKMASGDICSPEFLCWLHKEFYRRLPPELGRVENEKGKTHKVEPGKVRDSGVSIGRHMAPASKTLRIFLKRFAEFYGPLITDEPHSLVAAAAAHHRLTWIHPFLDGNGRVARLFTHAWFAKSGIDADGLWTISRGLARRQDEYRAALASADEKRLNDFDGRGYLSQRFLTEFCKFLLHTAVDQVEFMKELLALERMEDRILGYARQREFAKELPRGSGFVLRELFLRGEIRRGEVARITGTSPRTAQTIIRELLAARLVTAESPKGPLHLGFPAKAAGHYFPNLYPAGTD